MPAIFELDQFEELPLWAQVLVAVRLARRGALAMLTDVASSDRSIVLDACDAIERCAAEGDGVHRAEVAFRRAADLRGRDGGGACVVFEAVWWVIDAARAAQAAGDFPVDMTVSRSARNAIASLAEDRRLSRLQLLILLAGDLDVIRFTSAEARIGRYDGLTRYVFERLAPVHPLTVDPDTLGAVAEEDLAR